MMWDNGNPNQVFLIEGDISKTLTNCATDANPNTRQEYGRILLFILQHQPLEEILKNIHDITSTLLMISEDEISTVRIHLVDQIAGITLQVREHASSDLEYYLYDRLLQILLKYFQDDDYVVKSEASSALILLLDKGAIDKKMLIEKVCPTILNYTKKYSDESDEGRTSTAIVLMGRVAPIIGGAAVEEIFLDNYLEMCSCTTGSIQHSCATIFPIMCQVLGTNVTEEKLLKTFSIMSDSPDWALRKICAESLALIASACSPEYRRDRLTPVVLKLAKDSNNRVVSATFKVLGQFIATFSTPRITGLAYSQEGELYVTNPLDSEFSKHSDPQLVASYNEFINRADQFAQLLVEASLPAAFSSLKLVSTTSLLSSTTDRPQGNSKKSDSLSCEEISKVIYENIQKINKQINEDVLMKKRKLDENYRRNYSEILMGSGSNSEEIDDVSKHILNVLSDSKLNIISLIGSNDLITESDSLNNFIIADNTVETEETSSSLSDTEGSVVVSGEVDDDNNSKKLEDDSLSSIEDIVDPSNNAMSRKVRKSLPTIEHFWRKNTPTDLSSIIKNAIVESKKLNQQPLHERGKLLMPPAPSSAAVKCETPTSEQPIQMLAWDAPITNDMFKSKSTDRLNEFSVDEANNLTDLMSAESDDEAFNDYNSHKYWYITPELVLDNDLVNDGNADETFVLDDYINTRPRFEPPTDFNQNIVPVSILETFVKMVLQDEDEDVNLTCAYDFPAVAFTIGKQNWHILKKLLQYLCDDLDWKVRKKVASYIDLLAIILGKKLTTQDLLPIFLGFFKDLDQVKIKAIGCFAKFIKFVDFVKHKEILSNIGICLRIDSKTNWRIKEDLAQQILLIIKWYDSLKRYDYILYLTSVTGIFLDDKISCVREIGAEAMAEIIRICSEREREAIIKYYLVKEFSLSYSWRKRQTFVNIFYKYIKDNKNGLKIVKLVLLDIRRLSYDAVPNIRLLVARSLVQLVNNDSNILTSGNCEDVDIITIIRRLQEDDDRDVSETACLVNLQGDKTGNNRTQPLKPLAEIDQPNQQTECHHTEKSMHVATGEIALPTEEVTVSDSLEEASPLK